MAERNYKTHWDDENYRFVKEFKDGAKLEVVVNDLPQAAQDYLLGYGITQVMNDCHAGAKDLDEIKRLSEQKANDLQEGVIRRRSAGLGIGVDIEKLTKALANVKFDGDAEKAKSALAEFVPDEEADDEDTVKAKKARLRAIRNFGAIKMELDRLEGKTIDNLLG